MKNLFVLLSLLFCTVAWVGPYEDFEQHYGQFIERHYRGSGVVEGVKTTVFDYVAMQKEVGVKDSSFELTKKALEALKIEEIQGSARLQAFLMNAFNFAGTKVVLEKYPVSSIRDRKISFFKNPWGLKALNIGGKKWSMGRLEKKLLKNSNDPRLAFALNCAVISCPDRWAEPFRAKHLEKQLDKSSRDYLANQTKGLNIDKANKTLWLSWLFKHNKKLFKNYPNGLLGFIKNHAPKEAVMWVKKHEGEFEIRYFKHNWGLNDVSLSKLGES